MSFFCSKGAFTSFLKYKKPQRSHKTVEVKGFLDDWCLMMGGSGSVPLPNGSGSRSLKTLFYRGLDWQFCGPRRTTLAHNCQQYCGWEVAWVWLGLACTMNSVDCLAGWRSNMDFDLESLSGLHVHCCGHWPRPRGRYLSAKIDDI